MVTEQSPLPELHAGVVPVKAAIQNADKAPLKVSGVEWWRLGTGPL